MANKTSGSFNRCSSAAVPYNDVRQVYSDRARLLRLNVLSGDILTYHLVRGDDCDIGLIAIEMLCDFLDRNVPSLNDHEVEKDDFEGKEANVEDVVPDLC